MTIIQPHKHTSTARFFIFLFAVMIGGGLIFIFEYNTFVNAHFAADNLKKEIVTLETSNANLKNVLYGTLDPEALQALATERGLVLEKRPAYLTVNTN